MTTEAVPDLKGETPEQSWNNRADGSGVGSDIVNTAKSIQDGDGLGIGLNTAASALDVLGMVEDPLASLASAGVGWLIEHLSFLREPLDKLAGDPGEIQAQANTWTNISKELEKIEKEYGSQLDKDLPDWQGDAAQAYKSFGKELGEDIGSLSQGGTGVSSALTLAGTLVGTTRGVIRDLISTFVGKMIERALIALAASWCTLGGSVAAFIADAIAEGGIVAGKCASKIAEVLQKLSSLLGKFEKLSNAIAKLAKKFDGLAKSLGHGVGKFKSSAKGVTKAVGEKGDSFAASLNKRLDQLPEVGKAAKQTFKEQFETHPIKEGGPDVLPPGAFVEGARQEHEAIEHTKEGNEHAEEKVEPETKGRRAE